MSEEFTEEQTVLETEDTFEMVQPSGAKSFICMYDNALEDDMCDKLVELFDKSPK